jgi:EAL domain-containing protein (putative c-di-GMP-specific phosphodiesterase class I)
LIRWQHPQRGLLPPAAFIPLAEETGAIFAIGQWVLQTACRAAAAWGSGSTPLSRRPADQAPPFVSVNLAPIQLQQVDLVEVVASTLAETQLDPARLVLEITESSLLDDSRAIQTLRGLKELGVRLAVDDFGTGYSSLHYLQRFPLDALKIPKTFVDHLGEHSDQSALARAIIELGRTFGLDVIAEGIERPEQLAHLRALGCKAGQGFLLAHPRDAAATEALLRNPPLLFTPPEPAFEQNRALQVAASV